jgi:hypothetical protein
LAGALIDWDRHTVFESTSVSLWGHDFSVGFGADEAGNWPKRRLIAIHGRRLMRPAPPIPDLLIAG